MTITITCQCGKSTTVPDHYAGRTGRCNNCGAAVVVPSQPVADPPPLNLQPRPVVKPAPIEEPLVAKSSPVAMPPSNPAANRQKPSADADPVFARDSFLLRQKHLAINEKYAVSDDTGAPLLFVERPAHLLRNLLAVGAAIVASIAVFTLTGFTYEVVPEAVRGVFATLGILLGIVTIFVVYIALEQKRHVEFYRDERRSEKLLRVVQDTKIQLLTATYTVTDAAGNIIGTFSKNYLWDLIFKSWECRDAGGRLLFKVQEDSFVKAILRRLFGPLFGLLRLDFVFCDPISEEELGRFNRSFTLLDRYVLDMGSDRGRRIDRRLALAMGVMLDTGERR